MANGREGGSKSLETPGSEASGLLSDSGTFPGLSISDPGLLASDPRSDSGASPGLSWPDSLSDEDELL